MANLFMKTLTDLVATTVTAATPTANSAVHVATAFAEVQHAGEPEVPVDHGFEIGVDSTETTTTTSHEDGVAQVERLVRFSVTVWYVNAGATRRAFTTLIAQDYCTLVDLIERAVHGIGAECSQDGEASIDDRRDLDAGGNVGELTINFVAHGRENMQV